MENKDEEYLYPRIQGNGSLIVAWRVNGKDILIVGGGSVAASRIVHALEADARVTVVCPRTGLNNEVLYRITKQQVEWIDRSFEENDINGRDMVLTAIDDHELSKRICMLCREKKIPVNVADVPPECDFYFMSQVREGPLQIAVSTSGQGPRMARIIRQHIERTLPPGVGNAVRKIGALRTKVKEWDPDFDASAKRMEWMTRMSEEWGLEDLGRMEENDLDALVEWYWRSEIPKPRELLGARSKEKNNGESPCPFIRKTLASSNAKISDKKGRIALVGAGPGSPELLTIKTIHLLQTADLVVSDRLIPSSILDLVKGELRIARKTEGKSDEAQAELFEWCLEGYKKGYNVVRLKIGDPFVFGRGGEEVLEYRAAGIEVDVVAGISSALSAPLAAMVPVTMRSIADQVLITTGRGQNKSIPEFPTYHPRRTIVVLMAVGTAKTLRDILLNEKNYPFDLPIVWVQNANTPEERSIWGILQDMVEVAEKEQVEAPSVLVIGWTIKALNS